MESNLEVSVNKPRCPFCHENIEASDRKWGCPACMAWHHQECAEEAIICAACEGGKPANPETLHPGTKLSAVIAKNLKPELPSNKLANLAKELRFLEKSLLENLKPDLQKFVYPGFQGLTFGSRVAPPAGYSSMGIESSELFGTYHYLLRLSQYSSSIPECRETSFLETPHYRSLHQVPAMGNRPYYRSEKDGPLFDLLRIEYFIVRDPQDPYNSGQNLQVIAYAEENYHFLIQLLHDLLLSDKIK